MAAPSPTFEQEYADQRRTEGRSYSGATLSALPYVRKDPHALEWAVRARSYECLLRKVVRPRRRTLGRPLQVIDLGAGNGWLSYRLALEGNQAVAVDVRNDTVDGLGAARELARKVSGSMSCCTASFDDVPVEPGQVDLAIFNASLHYAANLPRALAEACRLLSSDGMIVVMDSPFYRGEGDGAAMVEERGKSGQALHFLTRRRLETASAGLDLQWLRRRVRYPLWYELRPWLAALKGNRAPSRFDLWIGQRL